MKKITLMLTCLMLTAGVLSGCGSDKQPVVEPSAAGWTVQSLTETASMYGVRFTYPLNISCFEADKNFSFTEVDDEFKKDYVYAKLMYKGGEEEVLWYKNTPEEYGNITMFRMNSESNRGLIVNGIKCGSKRKDVIRNLGQPEDEETDSLCWIYRQTYPKKTIMSIGFDDNDKVKTIDLFL